MHIDLSPLSIVKNAGLPNLKIRSLIEARHELEVENFMQIGEFEGERILVANCSNNLDVEEGQIQADISIISNNSFRIEKVRVKNEKFVKNEVQKLVDDSMIGNVHMSNYGGEQNILLPQEYSRLYCDLHTYLNINTYLIDEADCYFETRGGRYSHYIILTIFSSFPSRNGRI